MDHNIRNKLEGYNLLIQLTQKQIQRVEQSLEWDHEHFTQFDLEWTRVQEFIMKSDDDSTLPSDEEIAIKHLIAEHNKLINLVSQKMGNTSIEVIGVRQNQTIMNAYYGLGRSEQVSYYFDEKK